MEIPYCHLPEYNSWNFNLYIYAATCMNEDSARAGDSAQLWSLLIFTNTSLHHNVALSKFALSLHVNVTSVEA